MPGIDATSVFWATPSTINKGNIKLAALMCVSCTIWRITSLFRFLLGLCNIYVYLNVQPGKIDPTERKSKVIETQTIISGSTGIKVFYGAGMILQLFILNNKNINRI